MPRHRKERVSRYRASQRIDESARRAELDAAQAQARPGAAESSPSEVTADAQPVAGQASAALPGEDGAVTEPLSGIAADRLERVEPRSGAAAPGVRQWDRPSHRAPRPPRQRDRARRSGRLTAAAHDPADAVQAHRQGMIRGATRGLLVTPWFAAGMGFLLAAGLWIYSPHASLKLSTPNFDCVGQGCGSRAAHGKGGALAASGPGQEISSGHDRGHAKATGKNRKHALAPGVTLKYRPRWDGNGKFAATITITGKHPLGSWQLSFTMPGTQITDVWGAAWQPLPQQDGGIASPSQGPPPVGPSGQAGNNAVPFGNDGPAQGSDHPGEVTFWISGTGKPSTPVDCRYDGKSCSFS
jgi:hypothetical protein